MRLAAALVLLVARGALALPPDARIVLAPGTERFIKPGFLPSDVAVDPPGAFKAELQPSGEIFVEVPAAASGIATLFAIGADGLLAWDVCLAADPAACPKDTVLASARKACPDLAEIIEDGQKLQKATIGSIACLDALRDALGHATVSPWALRFVIDEGPANELYKRVLGALQKDPITAPIKAGFLGVTLRLSGPLTRKGVTRAVVTAWRELPGRVSFDVRGKIAP